MGLDIDRCISDFRWPQFLATQLFTGLQGIEYYVAPFTILDSVYGSTFFLTTGAHGMHVLVGSSFLLVCFFRVLYYQFNKEEPVGFELAA